MTGSGAAGLAVDCHVHVFDPTRFPYSDGAGYRPAPNETATAEQLVAVLDSHGIGHALVVNPTSGYGSRNEITLDALKRYPDRLRGIAVARDGITAGELHGLARSGFAGVRIDLIGHGPGPLRGPARRLVGMLRESGLILELQLDGEILAALRDDDLTEAGTLVIDHMGRPDAGGGLGQPGFRRLLALAHRDSTFVKLSGPFRFSRAPFPYRDADAYAVEILRAFGPARCVWGSDWPFVRMDHRIDYGPALAALARWVPDPAARRQVLWETPRRLFGFVARA